MGRVGGGLVRRVCRRLGPDEVDPRDYDLPNLKRTIYKNGEVHSEGLGSAVQGNPLTAVAWLANTLGEFGIPFKAGEVILSGSLAPLIPVVASSRLSWRIASMSLVNTKAGTLLTWW